MIDLAFHDPNDLELERKARVKGRSVVSTYKFILCYSIIWESRRVALRAEQALGISNSEFQYHFKRIMTLAIYFT